MNTRLFIVFIFISSMSLAVKADSLQEIATFSERICSNIVEGHITRTNIETSIKADIPGLAKAMGLSVGADGTLKHGDETYVGIPIEKLPAEILTPAQCKLELAKILIEERNRLNVTYNKCRLPDFGQEGWNRSENYEDSSDWIDGGHDQPWWCDQVANSFINTRKIGPQHEVKTLRPWEESNKDWKGHVTYKYHCIVQVSWDPLYVEKTDPRCGVSGK